ncbi:hypothetical protein OG1X_2345 [Enterococcus faecalis OG1X]|nr:hypothetical protein OG1X_2345 [Enterococcus faecalis OG1X]
MKKSQYLLTEHNFPVVKIMPVLPLLSDSVMSVTSLFDPLCY